MSQETDLYTISSRKALKVAVGALCSEVGFEKAEESAIETLTEMLQSFLTEVGRSTQAYSELAGRTEGIMTDVMMALIEMGQNIHTLPDHAKRPNKTVFIPPSHTTPQPNIKMLQTGDRREHPSYIPDHLPSFPDPHTYIKTLTKKAPVSEYQMIREKAASQKRDVERALTRFIAKTGETQSLFRDDTTTYPLLSLDNVHITLVRYIWGTTHTDFECDYWSITAVVQIHLMKTTSNTVCYAIHYIAYKKKR